MVILGINGIDYIAGCDGVSLTRMSRAQCGPAGRRSGIGVENEARRARTKDGAGGGPAEEQVWARQGGTRNGAAQDQGVPDSDARTG